MQTPEEDGFGYGVAFDDGQEIYVFKPDGETTIARQRRGPHLPYSDDHPTGIIGADNLYALIETLYKYRKDEVAGYVHDLDAALDHKMKRLTRRDGENTFYTDANGGAARPGFRISKRHWLYPLVVRLAQMEDMTEEIMRQTREVIAEYPPPGDRGGNFDAGYVRGLFVALGIIEKNIDKGWEAYKQIYGWMDAGLEDTK
jgi:hypothetical protein